MVLHAIVEKLTTWKVLLLLSQPHCPRKYLFSLRVASSKVQAINVLNVMIRTAHRQAKEGLIRRAQSHLTQTAVLHILLSQFPLSLPQARCCLKRLRCLATQQTHILPSPWDLNIALLMVCLRISRFRLIRHMCLPPHICTIQAPRRCRLINRLLPSRSNQSHSIITQGMHQLPIAVIHRMQDTEPNKGIIRIILPHPHHRMGILLISGRRILGIPHSPCQLGILHRLRQLLLPTLNTEEMVNFLVDKEKEEKPPKELSSTFQFAASSSVSSKSVAFIPLCCCVCYPVFTTLFSCYSLCNPCSSMLRAFLSPIFCAL